MYISIIPKQNHCWKLTVDFSADFAVVSPIITLHSGCNIARLITVLYLFEWQSHTNTRTNCRLSYDQSTEETCVSPIVLESSFPDCVMKDNSTASHAGFAVLGALSSAWGDCLDAILPSLLPPTPLSPFCLAGKQKSLKHLLKFSSRNA